MNTNMKRKLSVASVQRRQREVNKAKKEVQEAQEALQQAERGGAQPNEQGRARARRDAALSALLVLTEAQESRDQADSEAAERAKSGFAYTSEKRLPRRLYEAAAGGDAGGVRAAHGAARARLGF